MLNWKLGEYLEIFRKQAWKYSWRIHLGNIDVNFNSKSLSLPYLQIRQTKTLLLEVSITEYLPLDSQWDSLLCP